MFSTYSLEIQRITGHADIGGILSCVFTLVGDSQGIVEMDVDGFYFDVGFPHARQNIVAIYQSPDRSSG